MVNRRIDSRFPQLINSNPLIFLLLIFIDFFFFFNVKKSIKLDKYKKICMSIDQHEEVVTSFFFNPAGRFAFYILLNSFST